MYQIDRPMTHQELRDNLEGYTLREAAEVLKIPVATARYWAKVGRFEVQEVSINAKKRPGKFIVTAATLERFQSEHLDMILGYRIKRILRELNVDELKALFKVVEGLSHA